MGRAEDMLKAELTREKSEANNEGDLTETEKLKKQLKTARENTKKAKHEKEILLKKLNEALDEIEHLKRYKDAYDRAQQQRQGQQQ